MCNQLQGLSEKRKFNLFRYRSMLGCEISGNKIQNVQSKGARSFRELYKSLYKVVWVWNECALHRETQNRIYIKNSLIVRNPKKLFATFALLAGYRLRMI